MQKLEIPKRDDEKYRSINDIVKSPVRSPSKFRNVQTIQTGLTEIKFFFYYCFEKKME